MAAELGARVDDWFSLDRPVTYWTFWIGILRTVPVLLLVLAGVAGVVGMRLATVAISPVPFVFVAATFGFAARNLDGTGMTVSGLAGVIYGLGLGVLDIGRLLLTTLSPLLWVFALLTVAGGIAGFLAQRLHAGTDSRSLHEAQRQRRE